MENVKWKMTNNSLYDPGLYLSRLATIPFPEAVLAFQSIPLDFYPSGQT
jgi:hypothetical protein